jgi:membrane protein
VPLSSKRLGRLLIGIWTNIGERNLGLISAGVAFFAFLAVFPAVAALIAVLGFLADPTMIAPQLELLSEFVPQDAYRLLSAQVLRLVALNDSTLGWASAISTLAALWSARRGISALVQGLNAIHGARNRGGLGHAVLAILLTLVLIGVALVAILSMLVVPIVMAFVPLGPYGALGVSVAKWGLALGVVLLGVALVYRYGPNLARPPRWLSPGLFAAVFLWAAVSVGFSRFLSNFGNYNEVYGSIGAVIALLMWFYLSAWVVLFGAVLNAELEKTRAPDQ